MRERDILMDVRLIGPNSVLLRTQRSVLSGLDGSVNNDRRRSQPPEGGIVVVSDFVKLLCLVDSSCTLVMGW